MNPKKKSRRYRVSVSIHALDLAISHFTHSLGYIASAHRCCSCTPSVYPKFSSSVGNNHYSVGALTLFTECPGLKDVFLYLIVNTAYTDKKEEIEEIKAFF